MTTKLSVAIASITLLVSPASAQSTPQCELHVWPTRQIGAVYHGASASYAGPGTYAIDMYLSPMDQVAKRLGESIEPSAQNDAITRLELGSSDRFKEYRVIFHDPPDKPKYANWIDKNVGIGARDSDSMSPCYAELHIIFITLFRTAISKKIQTGFLFRDFGESQSLKFKAIDAGSTGAPAFESNDKAKSPEAVASVRAAFQENLRIFLRKKKMRTRPA
jgi:hypothetical protein